MTAIWLESTSSVRGWDVVVVVVVLPLPVLLDTPLFAPWTPELLDGLPGAESSRGSAMVF